MKRTFGQKIEHIEYRTRKACYAVIFDATKQQLATVLTTTGNYFLPGGGMEVGETAEQCLQREVLEETGYKIKIISYIGEAQKYFLSTKNEPILNEGVFYLAELLEKIQEPIDQDHMLTWIDIDNADELLLHEHHAWAVKEVYNKTEK